MPPFRRTDASAYGLTDAAVLAAVRRGHLVRLGRGVYAGARTPRDHGYELAAALARVRVRSAVASHGSAAWLHDLERLGSVGGTVRLTKPGGSPWRDDAVRITVADLPPEHVTRVGGLPVTTPARTVVDLGRGEPFRDAVVIADSALRRGLLRSDLEAVLRACHVWPGIAAATAVVMFADGLAENPLESVSRVAMYEAGLPVPVLQAWVGGDDAGPIGIVDFLWKQYGVVGEADGLSKYTTVDVLRAEKLRQERLERAGFLVVRWTWDDVWRQPAQTMARIGDALRRRGWTPSAAG